MHDRARVFGTACLLAVAVPVAVPVPVAVAVTIFCVHSVALLV